MVGQSLFKFQLRARCFQPKHARGGSESVSNSAVNERAARSAGSDPDPDPDPNATDEEGFMQLEKVPN